MIKTRVISNNMNLINHLKEHYDVTIKRNIAHLFNVTEDFMIIDDSLFRYDDIVSMAPFSVPTFYVSDKEFQQNTDSNHITVIRSNEIINHLQQHFNQRQPCSNAISFYGTLSGIGTTSVAMSIAKAFASKGKTCVLSLTMKSGLEFLSKPHQEIHGGLGMLLPHLVANTLTKTELLNAMIEQDGVWYLYGISSVFSLVDYTIEQIESLIILASKSFDTVIVDAGGGGWLSCMALATLKVCQQNHILVTSQLKSQTAWNSIQASVNCLKLDDTFRLIISRYKRKTDLLTERQIKRHYEMPYVGTLDEAMGLDLEAELKRQPIAELSKVVDKQIQTLVTSMV